MVDSIMKLHKCEHCAIRCRGTAKPAKVFW